jgi:hypothetical protein
MFVSLFSLGLMDVYVAPDMRLNAMQENIPPLNMQSVGCMA